MVVLEEAAKSLINAKVTPLIGACFFDELIKTIDKARIFISVVQYQWKWNIHQRQSKIQMLGDAIARARKRNVAVNVILNRESPRRHLTIINRVTGDRLGEFGCKVKQVYVGAILHTKLWVIDGRYTFVGSHNISTRSLTANEEVSVKIESVVLARIMKDYISRLWG